MIASLRRAGGAAACVGTAVWCSLGTLGLTTGAPVESRLAVLPAWWLLPVLIAGALIAARVARLSSFELSPLFVSGLLILPWIPIPLPAAAFLWTGPVTPGIWIAIAVAVIAARGRPIHNSSLSDPKRAPIVAAVAALVVYGAIAWWLSPRQPSADEPHYLIITQSLISDGDLRIENNHQQGDYLAYFPGLLKPDFLKRGKNAAIYSIHAPGLPLLIAPAFAVFGYPGAVAFLALMAAFGTALVWRVAHHTTGDAGAAWFGWATGALTVPFAVAAAQIFPDGIAATCVLVGILPLIDGRRSRSSGILSSVALAALPWLHTRFAVMSGAAALCLLIRAGTWRQRATFLAVPLLSAVAWFGYFYAIYGTMSPSAPYGTDTQTAIANLPRGVPGLLFDQQFGLIANAPVYGFVIAGLIVFAMRLRRWSWDLLMVSVPYVAAVGMFYMWWGGTSVPARFLTPLSLVLGVGAARIWKEARSPATRAIGLAALGASILIATVLLIPGHGRLLFNDRSGFALWLEWANDLVDLPRGMPSLFRDTPLAASVKAAIWVACFGGAWLLLQVVAGKNAGPSARRRLPWATIACLAGAVMVAFTLDWSIGGAQPVTAQTAQASLVRRAASRSRSTIYSYARRRFESPSALATQVRLRNSGRRPTAWNGPLLALSDVPAGTYRIHIDGAGQQAEGMLALRVGWASPPVQIWNLRELSTNPVAPTVRFPVAVGSVLIEGDEHARRAIQGVELEPSFDRRAARPLAAGTAVRAAKYGPAIVYFMDDGAFAEPEGFWVAGREQARVAIVNDQVPLRLFLRNAPVENVVDIETAGRSRTIAFGPGEETTIELPETQAATRAVVVRIRTSRGFRPFDRDHTNLDMRYLGCWVEIR